MRSAQGVISKSYSECTREEISEAYKELFGVAPCGNCQGVDWKQKYNKVVKQYAKIKNIKITMGNAKFIWNPLKAKVFTFVNGKVVTSDCKDQAILEKLFNNPKKDVVILNPNFKVEDCHDCDDDHPCEECEEKKKQEEEAVKKVTTQTDKQLVKSLFASGKTVDVIKEETGISKTKIKEYLKSSD